MDLILFTTVIVAAVLAAALVVVLLKNKSGPADQQSELIGRLTQMAESNAAQQAQFSERLQAQERALSKTLEERLADLSRRIGENLQQSSTKTGETMTKLQERLAVIDAAQKNITELSSQVVGLQDVLSNKQARGAFGEIQLQDLVQSALPPSAFSFQATLGNGKRADCLIRLPNPPGSIVIDAKFPLESYRALTEATGEVAEVAAGRQLIIDVNKHVNDIAERYIVPGETAESALMFLPSEAVYAELHANFAKVVEHSYSKKVWIVSPTTLMATLNTVRAILKDAQMQEQASVIQNEVMTMLGDVARLDQRVANLEKHFGQAENDLREIRISAEKVSKRGERITDIELGEEGQETDSLELASTEGGARIHRIGE
ncbi:MAG: DNA recombination protein RmuC [Rhodospirillaceae bacterium]|nr:DNA recombination protein RmuC [Rhodospirillaceae bacterium]|tara:strand:- start:5257 stop:6381 length:1125 start_codon:yes stop_codon:yes gene_type:complete